MEKQVFCPILVDGVQVNAQRAVVNGSYAYTDVGWQVRPLLAKNWLKGIYIIKQVIDAAGNPVEPDGLTEQPGFTLRVTLTAPNGDASVFPKGRFRPRKLPHRALLCAGSVREHHPIGKRSISDL